MEPIRGEVWLVFDLTNGHPGSHRYCNCFESKELAQQHIKHIRSLKGKADLSDPIHFVEQPQEPVSDKKSIFDDYDPDGEMADEEWDLDS